MSGLRSLQVRLLAGAALWSAGLLVAATLVTRARLRSHLEEHYSGLLAVQRDELVASLARDSTGRLVVTRSLGDPRFASPRSGLYWEVYDASGALVLASASLEGGRLGALEGWGRNEEDHGATRGREMVAAQRLVLGPGPLAGLRVVVAAERRLVESEEPILRPSVAMLVASCAALLLAGGGALVHRGLRTFETLRVRLAAVRAGDTPRLGGSYPTEIQPLVDDLNALLEHNDRAVRRATMQASNLAHALKTPLAVLTNEAHRLVSVGEAGVGVGVGEGMVRQVRLMEDRVGTYLARAGAAASGRGLGSRCDVLEAVDGIVRVMRRVHAERPLEIETRVTCGAFRGERRDLEEMLGNLLDNACKWARGRVVVECLRERDRIAVSVDDDGPGLAAAGRDAASGRGVRLDEATPGTGLGLAIVRELADTYGGSVALGDSPLGGLRATVVLPAASAATPV